MKLKYKLCAGYRRFSTTEELLFKGLSPVTRNLCCQSARGNRSGAVRYFPEAVRPRGNTAAPDRFPRADWQYTFLVTGLNPDYNMVIVRVYHWKVPNRGFQHHGRHFVLRRFWRFPLRFPLPPTLKNQNIILSFYYMSRDRSQMQ